MAAGHEDSNARRHLQIVVAGGSERNTVEAFDRETRTWQRLPQMSEVRAHASSVVYQNHIFVIENGQRLKLKNLIYLSKMDIGLDLSTTYRKGSLVTYVREIAIFLGLFSLEDGPSATRSII